MTVEAIPHTVICHYRVREGHVDEMIALIREHRKVLVDLGWVADAPEQVYLGRDQDGSGPLIITVFQWADAEAADRAHQHPEVGNIWTKMADHLDHRPAGPAMEFPHFDSRITL